MATNGLLLIDKPVGPTSMDIVRVCRRRLNTRKIGHTGTLDPLASGLLAITVGNCTKLAKFLTLEPKAYTFELVFGAETTTDDSEGDVVRRGRTDVSAEELLGALAPFLGAIEQVPPNFSAVRVDGRKAYDLARQGIAFELDARTIEVHSLDVLEVADGIAKMRVVCGTGTYVRGIARDIGRALGTAAHANAIRRTIVGEWTVDDAASVETLESHDDPASLLHGVNTMLAELPRRELTDAEALCVNNGRALENTQGHAIDEFVALAHGGTIQAVAVVREKNGRIELQPRRVLK